MKLQQTTADYIDTHIILLCQPRPGQQNYEGRIGITGKAVINQLFLFRCYLNKKYDRHTGLRYF